MTSTADELRDLAARTYRANCATTTSRRSLTWSRASRCSVCRATRTGPRSSRRCVRALPRAEVRDADVVERSFYNQDRAAWSERAKRAESQLALAMAWGEELADAARCEASLRWRWEARTDEARRALSIAETKSAGADVIVADAEARRVAAETRAIQAESRAERLERELAEARRGYDTVTAALEGGTGDPLAHALRRAEKAEREPDEIDAHKCQLSLMLRDAQRALGARKRVRIIAREPLDPAPQSPQTEIVLTSGPAGILFHVADDGSVGVLEDFLRYLGHEIVVDKPATLASPIATTGLDELVREAGADAAERAQRAKPSEPSETITITLLKEGDRVTANRGSRREPGTITKVERAGPDGWRCSIFFDEGSGVSWYGPREVAPLAPEHDPRNRTEDE